MTPDYRLNLAAKVLSESEAGVTALAALREFVTACEALDEIERASIQTVLNARLFTIDPESPLFLSRLGKHPIAREILKF